MNTMKQIGQKGLTILETLIAIGILAIIIGTALILMVNIANYSTSAETRGTAIQYAQEAVDIVKNVRDNKYCNFFSNVSYPSGRYYEIKTSADDSYDLSAIANPGWIDRYVGGTELQLSTDMRRKIRIENSPGYPVTEARRLVIEVDWQTKGNANRDIYKVVTDIYKWK